MKLYHKVAENRIIIIMNYIGLNIKKIREKWGLSQEEFAWLIHATRGMIMTYEVRGSKPRVDTIARIAKISGIRPTILVDTELQDEDIPGMRPEIEKQVNKGRKNPDLMHEVTQTPANDEPPEVFNKNIEYADKYVSLMETRVQDLEQDKRFLQRMLELNLGKASVMLQTIMKFQTAHDEVIMKSLDRLEKRPEGTLSEEADKLETEINQRLENFEDVDKKIPSRK